LFARPSNLLIMDEPTNDLDAETLGLLEDLVAAYEGTLLLVSHDRAFLDNVVTSTLVFEGEGRINEYVGGYADWIRQRKPAAPVRRPAPGGRSARGVAPGSPRNPGDRTKPAQAAKRRLSHREQRELDSLPAIIERLEAEQAELEARVSDPATFRGPAPSAHAAVVRLEALAVELANAYDRWQTLEAQAAG
jgi:ATP-binding cassette subfamily F protein uup